MSAVSVMPSGGAAAWVEDVRSGCLGTSLGLTLTVPHPTFTETPCSSEGVIAHSKANLGCLAAHCEEGDAVQRTERVSAKVLRASSWTYSSLSGIEAILLV
eukprot:2749012-Rhodomonas_salina.2